MKTILISVAMASVIFVGCKDKPSENVQLKMSTENAKVTETENNSALKEILGAYLKLKNALANDKTDDAAAAGTELESSFKSFDKTKLTAELKKTFEEVEDDAREHAEHIGKNGGNIKHQREHFELLSKDIIDLVAVFGGGQTLYKDYCPMYNKGKGAYWISETKEINNPYLGTEMPSCGELKEELK